MTSGAKTVDLISNLIENRFWGTKRVIQYFFWILPIIIFKFISIACEKIVIFSKFYLWWPLVTSILTCHENDLCKGLRSRHGLSNANGGMYLMGGGSEATLCHKWNLLVPGNNGAKFESLQKKIQFIRQAVVLCMHKYFHKIKNAPGNTLLYMTALQRHGWQK